jgi:predicted nucleic acid-binding protein
MAVEVANAWWKKARRRLVDVSDVEQSLTELMTFGIRWTPVTTLLRPAVRLAVELDHPVYDCVYLALAASQSAALATADERLRKAARRVGIRIWR